MKFLQLSYLSLIALCLAGCDPIDIDRIDDEPEFSINISLDGQEFQLSAGDDNRVLATEVIPILNITNYSGTLEDKDAPFSNPQFALKLRIGEEVFNSNDADHLLSFSTGSKDFVAFSNALLPYPEVIFSSKYDGDGTPNSYVWDYGDGDGVDFKNPVHRYPGLDSYNASVTITDDKECIAKATNVVAFDDRDNCIAAIDIINIDDANAVLEASSNGTAPFTYLWDNGSTANDNAIAIVDTETLQEVCVTVTDANNCVSINCAGIKKDASGAINTCTAEMTESNYTNALSSVQFNAVEVFYNDNAGLELSSAESIQGSDAYFNITSFEEFEMNDLGQRTVKIEFDFNCTVWETLARNPRSFSGQGSMAVAIPD